jgi:hypothetical protein
MRHLSRILSSVAPMPPHKGASTMAQTVELGTLTAQDAARYLEQAAHVMRMMADGIIKPDAEELRKTAAFYEGKVSRVRI